MKHILNFVKVIIYLLDTCSITNLEMGINKIFLNNMKKLLYTAYNIVCNCTNILGGLRKINNHVNYISKSQYINKAINLSLIEYRSFYIFFIKYIGRLTEISAYILGRMNTMSIITVSLLGKSSCKTILVDDVGLIKTEHQILKVNPNIHTDNKLNRYKPNNWDAPSKKITVPRRPSHIEIVKGRSEPRMNRGYTSTNNEPHHEEPIMYSSSHEPSMSTEPPIKKLSEHFPKHSTLDEILNNGNPTKSPEQKERELYDNKAKLESHINSIQNILDSIQNKINIKKDELNDVENSINDNQQKLNDNKNKFDSISGNQKDNADEKDRKRAEDRILNNNIADLNNRINDLKNKRDRVFNEIGLLDDLIKDADGIKGNIVLNNREIQDILDKLNREREYIKNDLSTLEDKKKDLLLDESNDRRKLGNINHDMAGHEPSRMH